MKNVVTSLILAVLIVSTVPNCSGAVVAGAKAQGVTGTDPRPQGVTGTDPRPQGTTQPQPSDAQNGTIWSVLLGFLGL